MARRTKRLFRHGVESILGMAVGWVVLGPPGALIVGSAMLLCRMK